MTSMNLNIKCKSSTYNKILRTISLDILPHFAGSFLRTCKELVQISHGIRPGEHQQQRQKIWYTYESASMTHTWKQVLMYANNKLQTKQLLSCILRTACNIIPLAYNKYMNWFEIPLKTVKLLVPLTDKYLGRKICSYTVTWQLFTVQSDWDHEENTTTGMLYLSG